MITLRKVSETATTITLGWDRVPGAVGYRFTVDGKVSHTFDPTRTTVKVSKGADHTLVEALGVLDSGVWPQPEPPPTGLSSPIGFISNQAPGYFPPTKIDQYGVIISEGPGPSTIRGIKGAYRTTLTEGEGT